MNKEAVTLTRFTDRIKISHAVKRTGSIRLHGMLSRASVRGPSGQKPPTAGLQAASSSLPEGAFPLCAPPTALQASPGEASATPPDSSLTQPPLSSTSDLGRFRSPSDLSSLDRSSARPLSSQNAAAAAVGSVSSMNQAFSDPTWSPQLTEPSGGYDASPAPAAGDGLSRSVAEGDGSVVKKADVFPWFPFDENTLDPFRTPPGTQEVQAPERAGPFLLSPEQQENIFQENIFQSRPKEGDKLFRTPLPEKETGLFQTPLPNGALVYRDPFSADNDLFSFSDHPPSEALSLSTNGIQRSPDGDPFFQRGPMEAQGSVVLPAPLSQSANRPSDSPNWSVFVNTSSASSSAPADDTVTAPRAALSPNLSDAADIFSPAVDPGTGVAPPSRPPTPARPDVPPAVTLTTPTGSNRGILQPTPFALALASMATAQPSPTPSGSAFSRPPKPVPRVRPQRPAGLVLRPTASPARQHASPAPGKTPPKTPPKAPPRPTLPATLRFSPSSPLTPEPLTPEPLTSEPLILEPLTLKPALAPGLALSPIAPSNPFTTHGPTPTLSPTLTPITASNPEPWMVQKPTLTPTPTSTSTPNTQLSEPHPLPSATPRLNTTTSAPLTHVTAPTPPPKPVPRLKQAAEKDPPEEDVVYLDIVLNGQERCVEDWPEDSPQLDPEFKPSGTFRLRRESMRVNGLSDGDGYSPLDNPEKKRGRKFITSTFLKGSLKDKYRNVSNDGKGETLLRASKRDKEDKDDISDYSFSKSSMEAFPETSLYEDEMEEEMDHKPKSKAKLRLGTFLRKGSEASVLHSKADGDQVNASQWDDSRWCQETQDEDVQRLKVQKSDSVARRWSEGMLLDDEEEGMKKGTSDGDIKKEKKNKLEIKFVPRRGFAISRVAKEEESKGASGYSPKRGSKGYVFEDLNTANIYTPQSTGKAAFLEEDYYGSNVLAGLNGDDFHHDMKDCRPKTQVSKYPLVKRRSSKEDMLEECSPYRPEGFSEKWEDGEEEELDYAKQKNPKHKSHKQKPSQKKMFPNGSPMGSFLEDEDYQQGEGGPPSPWGPYEEEEENEMDLSKPHKRLPKPKGIKKHKAKSGTLDVDPPGATSSDYFQSEAAAAEWLSAQRDERAMAGLEKGEDDGDTDSLMEWWNTVEQWDEVPSDDEDLDMKEDETKSFTALAHKVHRGLSVFDKVFTERAELLWQYIIALHAVTDDISSFHRKAKIASITGGTTTAVGGVAAIAGLALIPVTFGASLLLTAVGVGVVAAGGITSASASISDNVNNMHDRKKLEVLLKAYEALLLDLGRVLRFVGQGLYRLRGHPLLRAGNQHYAAAWEVRRAVQTIGQADEPVARAQALAEDSVAALRGLFQGMDKYFVKDSRELKRGAKAELVTEVRGVVGQLNDGLVELSAIRQELQDATGGV
ncbi:unnamed protein product [Gadus morhua 'NCC']